MSITSLEKTQDGNHAFEVQMLPKTQKGQSRDKLIIAMRREKMTYRQIGEVFGISAERVRQVLNRYGLDGKPQIIVPDFSYEEARDIYFRFLDGESGKHISRELGVPKFSRQAFEKRYKVWLPRFKEDRKWSRRKVSSEQLADMIAMKRSGASYRIIGDKYDMPYQHVWGVLHGMYVGVSVETTGFKDYKRTNRQIPDDIAYQILVDYHTNLLSYSEIMSKYGLARKTFSGLLHRRTYTDIWERFVQDGGVYHQRHRRRTATRRQ